MFVLGCDMVGSGPKAVKGDQTLPKFRIWDEGGPMFWWLPLSFCSLSVEPGEAGQLAQSKALPKNAVSVAMYLGRPKGR